MENTKFSVIIPAYNEEQIIGEVLANLKNYLEASFPNLYEIIVINDGSTDQTRQVVENISGVTLINHPYNKGYGAAIKTGVKNANSDWVLMFDSDGQHKPEYIKDLLAHTQNYDMIVGERKGFKTPLIRRPGKKILELIANYLVERKIPDLNSGLRLIKKEYLLNFLHLLPDGFSLSTTSTLAFFKKGLNVKYVPITINKRAGKSTVSPKDALKTLMLILRIIFLFSPLRIFLPASLFLFSLALIFAVLDLIQRNITDITILLFISSILIFFFGLLADQIAAIRREMK